MSVCKHILPDLRFQKVGKKTKQAKIYKIIAVSSNFSRLKRVILIDLEKTSLKYLVLDGPEAADTFQTGIHHKREQGK